MPSMPSSAGLTDTNLEHTRLAAIGGVSCSQLVAVIKEFRTANLDQGTNVTRQLVGDVLLTR